MLAFHVRKRCRMLGAVKSFLSNLRSTYKCSHLVLSELSGYFKEQHDRYFTSASVLAFTLLHLAFLQTTQQFLSGIEGTL